MRIFLNKPCRRGGFTLVEMLVCFAVITLVIGGMITGYYNSAAFAERAGYELAAEAQSVQMLERARAALWDSQSFPITDLVPTGATNIALLELPVAGTNAVFCTNIMTVQTVTNSNPTWYIKIITINSTWPWNGKVMSNTMVAYRAPDQ